MCLVWMCVSNLLINLLLCWKRPSRPDHGPYQTSSHIAFIVFGSLITDVRDLEASFGASKENTTHHQAPKDASFHFATDLQPPRTLSSFEFSFPRLVVCWKRSGRKKKINKRYEEVDGVRKEKERLTNDHRSLIFTFHLLSSTILSNPSFVLFYFLFFAVENKMK